MNKDNFLYALIGLLVGFISGYLLHEVMAARQPARALPGQAMAAPGAAGGQTEQPPAAGQQAGPSMEQIQQLAGYVQQNPKDAEAVLQLAHLNFDIQSWGRARDLYQQYLELRPENPDVLTDLGVTYRNLKDHEQALQLFRRAHEIAPAHWQSVYNQVIVLALDLKRIDDAEAALAELQRLQPGNPDVANLAQEVARLRGS